MSITKHIEASKLDASAEVCCVQLEKFNGEKVWTLQHLAQLVQDCTDEFFVFSLVYGETLVLDAKEARASTAEILRLNNIAHQMSPDLREGLQTNDKDSDSTAAEATAGTPAASGESAPEPSAGRSGATPSSEATDAKAPSDNEQSLSESESVDETLTA